MDQSGGIRNQKGGIWNPDQHCFLGIRDQAVPFLWDQGAKFVKHWESRIRDHWVQKWNLQADQFHCDRQARKLLVFRDHWKRLVGPEASLQTLL